jgi:RimJ/RimL family protein N-acetyltransferase
MQTDRLRMRDVEAADGEALYDYMKREAYWRNLPMERPKKKSVQSHIETCLRDQSETPRANYFWAAVSKETENIIGEAVLRITSQDSGQAAIGWAVDDRYARLGYGTEIGRALLNFGFDLGLHRNLRPVPGRKRRVSEDHVEARDDRRRRVCARRAVAVFAMVNPFRK